MNYKYSPTWRNCQLALLNRVQIQRKHFYCIDQHKNILLNVMSHENLHCQYISLSQFFQVLRSWVDFSCRRCSFFFNFAAPHNWITCTEGGRGEWWEGGIVEIARKTEEKTATRTKKAISQGIQLRDSKPVFNFVLLFCDAINIRYLI